MVYKPLWSGLSGEEKPLLNENATNWRLLSIFAKDLRGIFFIGFQDQQVGGSSKAKFLKRKVK